MIGLPRATAAVPGAGLPVMAAMGQPPAGLTADQAAFDEVFRQLTGGVLAMSTGGEARLVDAASDVEAASGVDAAATPDAREEDPAAVVTYLTVPVLAVQAAPVVELPTTMSGGGGDSAEGAVVETVPDNAPMDHCVDSAARGRRPAVATGPQGVAATPFAVSADGADESGTAFARAGGVRATVVADSPGAPASSASSAPADERAPGDISRLVMQGTPERVRPGHASADAPAVAAALRQPHAAAAPAEPAAFVDTPAGESATATPTPDPVREMPATAERANALGRALTRQAENTQRPGPAPGLVTQVAAGPSGAEVGAGGSDAGAGQATPEQKQGRHPVAGSAPGATLPATASAIAQAVVAEHAAMEAGPVRTLPAGFASSAAWRAALASSGVPETPAAPFDLSRAAALSGPAQGLAPTLDLPPLRDVAPRVLDGPLALPDLDAATGDAVHTQIVKSIRMQWAGGLGEARVTLKPEYLGEVTATVKVEHGTVTATLQADTPDVRRWMESHTATLRDALVEHGLKLDRLVVGEPERQSAQGDRQSRPRQQPPKPSPRPRPGREDAAPATPFDVTTE